MERFSTFQLQPRPTAHPHDSHRLAIVGVSL